MMKATLLAAAVSGIVLGASGAANARPSALDGASILVVGDASPLDGGNAKHACKGQNDCKGLGGCKTDKHACKAKNDCKAQGGCRTDGGKDDKSGGKNGCSGPNGCGKLVA